MPANLQASVVYGNSVQLNWQDVNYEEGYELERSLNGESGFTIIARPGISITAYRDSNLAVSTTYYYRLRSYRVYNSQRWYSAYSAPAQATTSDVALPAGIGFDMEFRDNFSDTLNRWIPNTGQNDCSFQVHFTCKDEGGADINLPAVFHIKTLAPIDPYWETDDGGANNLHRNKGTNVYELSAVNETGTEARVLGTFTLNAAATKKEESYVYTCNGSYFDTSTGKARNTLGYQFKTNNEGYLIFGDNGAILDYMAIRTVEDANKITRPGDDLLLRFDLADYVGTGFTAMKGDFVAVYDKKLMWRAQLYVDGGQIAIESWTLPYDATNIYFDSYLEGGIPVKTICNAVPYSLGCMDSPEDVNRDLIEQKQCLNISNAGGWDSTLAPGDEWNSYDHQERTTAGSTYYAYRPVYTSILYRGGNFTNIDPNGYQSELTDQSVGVDCNGFIQRAASYTGNLYAIKDVRWDGAQEENRLFWGEYDTGVKIPIDVLPDHGTESFYDLSWQVYDVTAGIGSISDKAKTRVSITIDRVALHPINEVKLFFMVFFFQKYYIPDI